jgi:glutathione peroxidase
LTSDNYTQLVDLYNQYKTKGLQILAFPCGQFFNQELKENADIKDEVVNKFGATFPMFSKITVNGPDTHPVYNYLKYHSAELNTTKGLKNIPWNFTKILVNENGEVVKVVQPGTKPMQMLQDIEKLLKN